MLLRSAALAALLALLVPAPVAAQGVAIEHNAIGCLVAGKYPVFNACFSPAGELARARVYFRAENTPHWYYVDMQSDAPCFKGTLPRPKKEIGGLSYYVEATDRSFNASRTNETAARVVGNAMECQKDVPVAPFLDKATVVVGSVPGAPVVPLGFAAGGGAIPAAAVVGVAGAGAAAAGTVVATNNDNGSTTTTPGTTSPTAPTTTAPPPPTTAPPTTTVPPSTTPAVNLPPTLEADVNPASGPSPLATRINLCGSRDPEGDELRYTFDFENDGIVDFSGSGAGCRTDHTYTGSPGDRFTARVCVGDRVAGHDDVCGELRVTIEGAAPVCTSGDESAPKVTWEEPNPFSENSITDDRQRLRVTVDDQSGITQVEFYASPGGRGIVAGAAAAALVGIDTTEPYSVSWSVPNDCNEYQFTAIAEDACGLRGQSTIFKFVARSCNQQLSTPGASAALAWTSELSVPGASAQLVLNGKDAFFPGEGRLDGTAATRRGTNRLEGQVVAAAGGGGTWRIELSGEKGVRAGSLRVRAGEVVASDERSVTFRLQGRAGERIVLEFDTP